MFEVIISNKKDNINTSCSVLVMLELFCMFNT